MSKLYDLARVTVSSAPGTGTISLGPAVFGFLTFQLAGIQDGDAITYAINDGQQSEIGHGTYVAASNTVVRNTVLSSTNGGINGGKINASATAQVFITIAAEDISNVFGGTVTAVSVVSVNGVSGTVSNPTTTPAITLALGAITPTTVNGLTITNTTGTFTLASSKVLTVNNSLSFIGTDATTMTFPTISSSLAPLLSPAFTGTPTAPTATVGTNTTQLATTAFVLANGTSSGVVSVGNASADTTLTLAGTGSGPWTGAVTAKLNLRSLNNWTAAQNILATNGSAFSVSNTSGSGTVLLVNTGIASVANGIQVIGFALGSGAGINVIGNASNEPLKIDAKGTGSITIGGTSTGNIFIGNASTSVTTIKGIISTNAGIDDVGPVNIQSNSANALVVGASASGGLVTNPAFNVDSSTASQVAGLNIAGAATGGTVAIFTIDSGSNTNLSINAKGTGTIAIGSVSTGSVTITPTLIATATTQTALDNSVKLATTAYVNTATRDKLSGNRNYFVATTGSDSNNGLTSGSPFLTIQKAINVVAALDLSIFNVTINVADGTYSGNVSIAAPWVGSGAVAIVGNATTPGNCIWTVTSNNGLAVSGGNVISVTGFEFRTATAGDCLVAFSGGQINVLGPVRYGTSAGSHNTAENDGRINIVGNYSIVGSAVSHLHAFGCGHLTVVSAVVTLSGTPAFSAYFAGVADSSIGLAAVSFSGSGTGPSALVHDNGRLDTSGVTLPGDGVTYFPDTWAQYNFTMSGTQPLTFQGSSSGNTTLQASATASGALTLPAATDTLVGKATTDTLSNKTLASPIFTTTMTGPKLIGGSGTTGTQMTFQTTTGVGTTDGFLWTRGNNGATTAMTLNNTGLGLGTTAPDTLLTLNQNTSTPVAPLFGPLHLIGPDSTNVNLTIDSYGGNQSITGRRANGTLAVPTAAVATNALTGFIGDGWNGTAFSQGGQFQITARETWNTSTPAQGTSVSMFTTPLGTASVAEAIRFQPSGGVSIGAAAIAADPGIGSLNLTGKIFVGATASAADAPITLNNNTAAAATPLAGTMLHLVGADATGAFMIFETYGQNAAFVGQRANGTQASKTTIVANNILCNFASVGWDGSAYSTQGPAMRLLGGETWSSSAHGNYIGFYTTPNTTVNNVESMRVNGSGGLSVGTTTDAGIGSLLALNDISALRKFILPSYTVATLPAGAVGALAFITDATLTAITGLGLAPIGGGANKVVVYYDGAWKIL